MSEKEDSDAGNTIPGMVRDLMRRAEARLAELQARKEHLRRRIQALRFLATRAAEPRPEEREEKKQSDLSSFQPPAEQLDSEALNDNARLRRACRIALMESDKPQSSREIFQRICQRGSLAFSSSQDPLRLIAAELQSMEKDSEVICCPVRGEKRWRRSLCE